MEVDEENAYNDAQMSTSDAGPSTLPVDDGAGKPAMSKSAKKKAAKQAKLEALKPLKRAAEKERRRARAAQLSAGYAAGTLTAEDKEIFERRKRNDKERKAAKKKVELGEVEGEWKGAVVVDLGFDELMNDQEISSISQQLGYLYSTNRTASQPFATILHTSFSASSSPRLWEKMSKSSWDRWSRCYWWSEGLGVLSSVLSSRLDPSASGESNRITPQAADQKGQPTGEGLEKYLTGSNLPPTLELGKHKLIYLSADAEEELDVLAEDEVYIIGGIVDRNRYKNLCQDKAEKLGIRTARLPIGKYLENLPTRKVLTVNQVFDILVKWVELRDWAQAFEAVIPQRKYHIGRKEKRAAKFADKPCLSDGEGAEEEEESAGPATAAGEVVLAEVDEEATFNA